MDLRVSYGLTTPWTPSQTAKAPARTANAGDILKDQENAIIVRPIAPTAPGAQGTRLINEQKEETATGQRRTLTFEQSDGRRFTKMEDISLTAAGMRRSVIQQNPSGGITRYDEALEREPSGTFRRTQRFQDAAGETSTIITPNYQVTDPFVLTGGNAPSPTYASSPFEPMRGTQLDMKA